MEEQETHESIHFIDAGDLELDVHFGKALDDLVDLTIAKMSSKIGEDDHVTAKLLCLRRLHHLDKAL